MASAREKQKAVALEEMPRNTNWDCEDDIYSHMQRKNRLLGSGTERLNYFNTLLQDFIVMDRGDPEMVQFMDGLYGVVKCQMLHLPEPNIDHTAEENCTEEEEEDDSVLDDPQYKRFLENLRHDGKSYVLDIPEHNVFVEYHQESSTPGTLTVCEAENVNQVSNEANVGSDTEMHATSTYKGKRRGRKPKRSRKHAVKKSNGSVNRVASEAEKHAPTYTGKRRGRKPIGSNPKGDHRSKHNHIHTDTPSGVATTVKVEIEDYDDDNAPSLRRPEQDLVLDVEQCRHDNEANARELTEFRERLMEQLKMPYCQEEYERLLQDITARKPVQHHRVLRGGIKIYEKGYLGKSLLDHHIDLAKKIDSGRDDHPRVLNLLRGFFYWLTNLSHDGAFMPWRDPSCLDVLPQQ